MTPRFGMLLLAGFLLGADDPAKNLKETLLAQEKKLIEAIKNKDKKTLKDMLAQEAFAINAFQGRQTGAQQLRILDDVTLTDYTLSEVKVVAASRDVGILTYVYTWKGSYKGKKVSSDPVYATSIWALRQSQWRSVFYQETPIKKEK